MLDFAKQVFDAVELERNTMANGFHVEARIGDSVVVLVAMEQPYSAAIRASIYVYVEDVDAVYKRALAAGATSLSGPTVQPYQERNAGVKDTFGNMWYIATYTGRHSN